MRGITGPEKVFEGNKGFKDSIAGEFEIDWSKEDLERVTKTIVKKFNAEIHSQATLEGVVELRNEHPFNPDDIEKVVLNTFDVAFHIIGGGEEGGKKNIRVKEEADHSLPYMMAAALLDGYVLPAQYKPERIVKDDIQRLLKKIEVYEKKAYSDRFPKEEACDITLHLKDGTVLKKEKSDYEGFHTRPASWGFIQEKFNNLTRNYVNGDQRNEIATMVRNFEDYTVRDLMNVLSKVNSVSTKTPNHE